MLKAFTSYIKKEKLFAKTDTILLTVSGGIDSIVLCELFKQAGLKFGIALSADLGHRSGVTYAGTGFSEFVIDFVKVMPGVPKAKVKARILLTPQHAKRLLAAMQDNIAKYEAAHGAIKQTEGLGIPMNFGGPAAQA